MGEAHVHGFVNRMRRDVVVLDVRGPLLDIHHYQPGYAAQRQISKRTASSLRFSALTEPIWLLLENGHWSALLPSASRADERAAAHESDERRGEDVPSDLRHGDDSAALGQEGWTADDPRSQEQG